MLKLSERQETGYRTTKLDHRFRPEVKSRRHIIAITGYLEPTVHSITNAAAAVAAAMAFNVMDMKERKYIPKNKNLSHARPPRRFTPSKAFPYRNIKY